MSNLSEETLIGLDFLAHNGVIDDDYLEHHGILGQKWGVRRYQNADGSLTEEGYKKIYGTANYERYSNRAKRSVEAAKYERDSDKFSRKITKNAEKSAEANAKGKTKKVASLKEKEEQLKLGKKMVDRNRELYIKDLSSDDIELGRQNLKARRNAALAYLVVGLPGAAVATTVSAITNHDLISNVKSAEQKRRDEYLKKYINN